MGTLGGGSRFLASEPVPTRRWGVRVTRPGEGSSPAWGSQEDVLRLREDSWGRVSRRGLTRMCVSAGSQAVLGRGLGVTVRETLRMNMSI